MSHEVVAIWDYANNHDIAIPHNNVVGSLQS